MRKINFAAGPSMMPQSVLETVRDAMIDFDGKGYSILELNHRSSHFDEIRGELKDRIRSLMSVPADYEILFCPGGGRQQFSMAPLNLLTESGRGGYVVTGKWSQLAYDECARIADAALLWKGDGSTLPAGTIEVPADVDYVYYCDNETVDGTEFGKFPSIDRPDAVVVADMSSNFMSRPVDVSQYGALWAGVQKNFGTSGLTVLIVRKDLIRDKAKPVPLMLDWMKYAQTDSVPNSVPVLQFYVALLMARWVESMGGLEAMDRAAKAKSAILYGAIDADPGMYVNEIPSSNRSRMNVVFRLRDESLTDKFVKEAESEGMINLAGHRSKGGIRVSLYNAMPIEAVEKLVGFMKAFSSRHAA